MFRKGTSAAACTLVLAPSKSDSSVHPVPCAATIVIIAATLAGDEGGMQVYFGVGLLIVCLSLQLTFRPFAVVGVNKLETLSLLASTMSLYCGLIFNVEKAPALITGVIAFFIVTVNTSMIVYFAYTILTEIRQKAHEELSRKLGRKASGGFRLKGFGSLFSKGDGTAAGKSGWESKQGDNVVEWQKSPAAPDDARSKAARDAGSSGNIELATLVAARHGTPVQSNSLYRARVTSPRPEGASAARSVSDDKSVAEAAHLDSFRAGQSAGAVANSAKERRRSQVGRRRSQAALVTGDEARERAAARPVATTNPFAQVLEAPPPPPSPSARRGAARPAAQKRSLVVGRKAPPPPPPQVAPRGRMFARFPVARVGRVRTEFAASGRQRREHRLRAQRVTAMKGSEPWLCRKGISACFARPCCASVPFAAIPAALPHGTAA